MGAKGKPKTAGSGRKKGTQNRVTKAFKEIMDGVLFDDPDLTRARLVELRDSDESADRKTFWGLAAKRLPNEVVGELKTENVVRVIDLTAND